MIDEPAHIGLLPLVTAIETDGVSIGFTTMLILFEVAVVGLAHVAVEVMIQVTACPFVRDDEVNVELFVPTFEPFTCH